MRMGSAAAGRRGAAILLAAFALTPAAFPAGASEQARAAGNYGKLPLSFEENRGQTDPRVKYISRGSGYALFLTPTDAVVSLTARENGKKLSTSLRMSFVGAREAVLSGGDRQQSHSSYFIGPDQKSWLTDLRHFGRVNYKGLYPGIDAVFYGNQRQLEYDFVVAPGADPKQIRLKFEGAKSVMAAPNGDLVLRTALGDLRHLRPVVYQEIEGRRRMVESRYKVDGNIAAFELGAYDSARPLVIDPVLAWSTFWGGAGADQVTSMAYDATGTSLLIAGETASADFRNSILFLGVPRGGTTDGFVAKLNLIGTAVIWSAFFGGTVDDRVNGVAVDSDGAVYITGATTSGCFPPSGAVTCTPTIPLMNPHQAVIGGTSASDAFVAKILPDASGLVYSTYLGGFQTDVGLDIEVDSQKRAVVVGYTESTNFPGPRPLYGNRDGFVAQFGATGARLWTTLVGGFEADEAMGVAVGPDDAIYVTGWTDSFSFPVTSGVVQPAIGSTHLGGGRFLPDAFAMKFSSAGATQYSTFLGGLAYDAGVAIAVDAAGNAYVFGNTESANFPTVNPLQNSGLGNGDTFVTKLNPNATARLYSTMLGGTGQDNAGDIAVRGDSAHVVGSTTSTNFPLFGATQAVNGGGQDVFVSQFIATGSGLAYSTYFGGNAQDVGAAIAVDNSGNIYIGGSTTSGTFPLLNPMQAALAGIEDGFIAKFSNCTVALTPTLTGVGPGAAHSAAASLGVITVAGPSDCTWNAQSNASWITISSQTATAGNGTLTYTVAGNAGAPRTGIITIAGVQFTIQQSGAPLGSGCLYPIDPEGIVVLAEGLSSTFVVGTSTPSCSWTAVSNVPWLQMFPGSGTGTTTLRYTVFPHFGTSLRVGTVTVTAQGTTRTFTVTQANPFLTEPERFVTLLYSTILGRYPRADEIAFHVGGLLSGSVSRGRLAAEVFLQSAEFQQGGRFVTGLYMGLLDRVPEYGGWLFQRNALSLGLVNKQSIVDNFLNSAEFMAKYGVLTNEQFVQRMYLNILRRNPEPAEIAFWAAPLNAGTQTRVQIATQFLDSTEFRIRTDNRMMAYLLYATLLGREPSTTELNNLELQLNFGGVTLIQAAQGFINSPEFQTRLQ